MTNFKTEFQSFSNWDTEINPQFSVHLRHEYCPEQRILTKNSNSPVLAVDPFPLYPAKEYYETNTLDKQNIPVATRRRDYDTQEGMELFSLSFQDCLFSMFLIFLVVSVLKFVHY